MTLVVDEEARRAGRSSSRGSRRGLARGTGRGCRRGSPPARAPVMGSRRVPPSDGRASGCTARGCASRDRHRSDLAAERSTHRSPRGGSQRAEGVGRIQHARFEYLVSWIPCRGPRAMWAFMVRGSRVAHRVRGSRGRRAAVLIRQHLPLPLIERPSSQWAEPPMTLVGLDGAKLRTCAATGAIGSAAACVRLLSHWLGLYGRLGPPGCS
jgi:hypothetical protein